MGNGSQRGRKGSGGLAWLRKSEFSAISALKERKTEKKKRNRFKQLQKDNYQFSQQTVGNKTLIKRNNYIVTGR